MTGNKDEPEEKENRRNEEPDNTNQGETDEPENGEPEQSKPDPTRRPRWFRNPDPVARFSGWLAIFTGILCFFTGILCLIGVLHLWSVVQGDRAFLSVRTSPLRGNALIPEVKIPIRYIVKNGGKTTAFLTHFNVNVLVSAHDLPTVPQYQELRNSVVGPVLAGGKYPIRSYLNQNNPYTLKQVNAIKSGKERLFIYGFVRYTDNFLWRTTGFCYVWAHDVNVVDNCGRNQYIYDKWVWPWLSIFASTD